MTGAKVKLNNRDLLRWARESAGYTVEAVARTLGKRESDIAAWESGHEAPTYRQLETLANKVKRSVAVFFLPSVPHEPPPPADFRVGTTRGRGTYEPKSLLAFRQARNRLEDLREILSVLELNIVFSLPSIQQSDNPEDAARLVRSRIGVSIADQRRCRDEYQASDLWRDAFFDFGVAIMVFQMPMADVRAFCLLDETTSLAAVGLNSADMGYGRIFSLIHEVCHLCLGKPGVSGEIVNRQVKRHRQEAVTERFCDRFAAGFLLPRNEPEVVAALREISAEGSRYSIDSLARSFRVSKYVMLRRALDLNYITAPRYWRTFNAWSEEDSEAEHSPGWADPVKSKVSRIGKRYASLVFEALDADKINLRDASRILNLSVDNFTTVRASLPGGTLRGD